MRYKQNSMPQYLPYSETVLKGIRTLREDDFLCDFTLIADGISFKVHRVLMAAVSDYFTAVFRSGMKETIKSTMHLKGVSADGLKGVLDFIYSGNLSVDAEIVLEVLDTAIHLQVAPAIEGCTCFFIQNLSLENIKDMQAIADTYQLQDLKNACHNFLVRNFTKFANTEYFKNLPVSEAVKLVRDNSIRCKSEYKIFKLVWGWMKHNKEDRAGLASNFLKHLRLPFMKEAELKELESLPFIQKNKHCRNYLEKARYFKEHPEKQAILEHPTFTVRSEEYVVAFGCGKASMHCCVLFDGEWCPMDRALGQPRPFTNAAAKVVNNFLYVCGGQKHITASCCSFNPYLGKWKTIAPMCLPRRNFTLASVGFNLYAIGGISRDSSLIEHVTDSVEVYSIEHNTWTPTTPLDIKVADLTSCTWKGKIYIAGGIDETCYHLKDFKVFDPETEVWTKKSDIPAIKFRPAMFATDNQIYLVDTYRSDGTNPQLEQYDLRSDQWSRITLTDVCFSRCFSAALVNNWIHFVGCNDVDDGASKRCNVKTGQVENINLQCCALLGMYPLF